MRKWKILLADDDPEDQAIIKSAMEMIDAGNIIQFADNGEQLLNILGTIPHEDSEVCLIVLDLNMPRLNGTETLRLLKQDERYQEIPVIIFSTSINTLEKEKCMNLGACDYITKPLSYKECIDTAQVFYNFCLPKSVTQ